MIARNTSRFLIGIMLITFAVVFQVSADTAANKALGLRIFEEIWNQGAVEVIDEILAADYVIHDPSGDFVGPEGYKQFHAMFSNAFPDLHYTIEDQAAEGDKIMTRWTVNGTHSGELMGIPPTSAEIVSTGITISRIADGKIVEEWNSWDMLGLMQQLGAIEPVPGAPPAIDRAAPEDFVWTAPSDVTGDPGDPEANKALVMREYDAWNQGDPDVVETVFDEIFAPDFVYHDPARPHYTDLAGYKQFAIEDGFGLFPGMSMPAEDIIAEGDKVIVRWSFDGTFIVSGQQVTQTGATIYRIADGKIVESWSACDMLLSIKQLSAPPEGYDNVFFMSLAPGLNIISVPLEPIAPYTARSLAKEIGATVVIRYDPTLGRFVGFTPSASGDGFALDGGEGYIVNVPTGGTVAFTGAAWTNEPPVAAAPPAQANTAWAFVVSGSVLDGDLVSASDGDYTAVVKNLRTGEMFTESVDPSGYFAAAWADLNRKAVIGAGDKVEVAVVDSSGSIVSGPSVYEVTLDAIRDAVVNVRLNLGDIVPAKSGLLQNYPNPFNPETWVPYHLSSANPVVVKIYSASGQLIRTLDLGHKDAGLYTSRSKAAYWDGKNETGEEVASAVYFYSITAGSFSATRKMVVKK